MPRLLLATTNQGKAAEYRDLLKGLDLELLTLDQAGISREAEEGHNTFEGNARSKAEFYAALSGLLTLADDSGLEVDALGGEPGVRSSRYAGDNATDPERVNFLLNRLGYTAGQAAGQVQVRHRYRSTGQADTNR